MIFHTAVLAYVPDAADRVAFAELVAELNAVWVANEAPDLLTGQPPDHAWPPRFDPFLLARDKKPVACARDKHRVAHPSTTV